MFWLFTLTDVLYSDCKFFSLYTASEKLILEKGSHSYLTNVSVCLSVSVAINFNLEMRNTASSGEIAAEKFRKERVQTYLSIETCKTLFFRNQNLQRLLFPIPSNDILKKKKNKKKKTKSWCWATGHDDSHTRGTSDEYSHPLFCTKNFFLFFHFFFSKVALCYAVWKAYFWQRSVDHHITWFASERQIIT